MRGEASVKPDKTQASADALLLLENQLCFPLYAAARKITGLYTPLLKPLGLTYTQYLVFLVLWEKDGISIGELGGRLFLDSGTLTPLIRKLEARGLIERRRSREDERIVLISLTEEGRALREKARKIPVKIASCVPLSPEDAADFYRLLYRILEAD
ncbi:MAG: MarR family transcriptional regulator [Lachnospiraceae bacterium]|nr:MarR family transcriptional regulator [Lachnospiraceae bacterium]